MCNFIIMIDWVYIYNLHTYISFFLCIALVTNKFLICRFLNSSSLTKFEELGHYLTVQKSNLS